MLKKKYSKNIYVFLPKRFSRGQSSTELAVFGAVLLFVIGLIIKQMMSFSYLQNQNYKALRMAMRASYMQSEGLNTQYCLDSGGGGGSGSGDCIMGDSARNSASILIVEDRLTSGINKYGTIDRAPYMNVGQATHSRNLFMPIGNNEKWNLPLQDVYVNGKHFVFSTAAFKTYTIGNAPGVPGSSVLWQDNCVKYERPPLPTIYYPCRKFYTRTYNATITRENKDFCVDAVQPECQECLWDGAAYTPQGCHPISVDYRFDLDRDGVLSGDSEGGFVPNDPALRDNFSWQWVAVMGVARPSTVYVDSSTWSVSRATLLLGDTLKEGDMIDIDDDGKLERVMKINASDTTGIINATNSINYMDYQEGDVDYTLTTPEYEYLEQNHLDPPGFTQDVQLFSYTNPETTLRIEQKLGSEIPNTHLPIDRRYLRTTQKKNRVDFIQRVMQISNFPAEYCTAAMEPTSNPYGLSSNPIERCCANTACCFEEEGEVFPSELTCYDDSKKKIYVRSRIADRHGRRWVSDITDREHVLTDW